MNNTIDLFAKFSAVEVVSSDRISETDKDFCERNQAAYGSAVTSYQELAFCWDAMKEAQREQVGERDESSAYFNYLSEEPGAYLDDGEIQKHLKKLHGKFLDRIASYFEDAYGVSLDHRELQKSLLLKEPDWDAGEEEKTAFQEKMRSFLLRYRDILDRIFEQMDGRSFSEQALHQLREACGKAVWDSGNKTPRYERKKDTIKFLACFADYTYRRGFIDWSLKSGMKAVMKAAGHFETGRCRAFPDEIEDLLNDRNKWDVTEFEECRKLKQLKLFKNGNAYLKFASAACAEAFASEYLGLTG